MKRLYVKGTEVEKNRLDGAWLNPKRYEMGNQQPSPEEGKVQRLSIMEYITSVMEVEGTPAG